MTNEERIAYLPKYFTSVSIASALNDAIISEAGSWQSCLIVMKPGKSPTNVWTLIPSGGISVLSHAGISGLKKMLFEFPKAIGPIKQKHIPDGKYYYVFNLGTHSEGQGKGFGGQLIRELQERASKDNTPIWLEATTESSTRLYSRLGFETVAELTMGKGSAGSDGMPKVGGEGFTLRPMIWRPAAK